MNGYDLYKKISDIDTDFIKEADSYKPEIVHRKKSGYRMAWVRGAIVAAALSFIALGISVYRDILSDRHNKVSYKGADIMENGNEGNLTISVFQADNRQNEKTDIYLDTVTVGNDYSEHVMQPDERVTIDEMDNILSGRIPGIKLKASYNDEYDSITFITEAGTFVRADENYTIGETGQNISIGKDEIQEIYWSPVNDDNAVEESIIYIYVMMKGNIIRQSELSIYSDSEGNYYGKLAKKNDSISAENVQYKSSLSERVIRVDGEIYYDTHRQSNRLRCGMYDGRITSQCPVNQLPEADNQSNFTDDCGYQYASASSIEVYIKEADVWEIFEK